MTAFIALAALAVRSPAKESPDPAASLTNIWAVALGLGACALAIWPWIGRGIPAFAHDWKWPLLSAQLDAWPSILHSLWLPWGAGAPAVQELAQYPIVVCAWAFGRLLSPAWALYLIVAALYVIASTGAARCARAFGFVPPWQALVAALYTLAPAVTNRLSAGHLPWLLGYALVPWMLSTLMLRERGWSRAGRLGLCWGFAAAQVQFLILAPAVLLAAGRRAFRWDIAAGALIACGLQAPMIAALLFGHPSTAFAPAHANNDWQLAQSSRATLALTGVADPAGYFQAFEPNAELLLAPVIGLALFGAFVTARAAPLALLWLGSTLWAAGMRGPLAAPFAYLFSHVLASSAFREFSHAQVLVTLPFLLLAAFGARAIAGQRTSAALAAFALIYLPAAVPALAASSARLDTAVRLGTAYNSVTSAVAALPGNGAVLWMPSAQPMRESDTRGGADSLALPVGEHPPFVEYRPSVPLIIAARALDAGDPSACGLLADLGVQAVVFRDTIATLPAAPANGGQTTAVKGLRQIAQGGGARAYAVSCYRGTLTWARASIVRGDWTALRLLARSGATDEISLASAPPPGIGAAPPPQSTYESDDIARGWVPLSQLDAYAGRFAGAFDDVAITSRPDAPLDGVAALASNGGAYQWMAADQLRALMRRGPVAVWQTGVAGTNAVREAVPSELPSTRERDAGAHELDVGASALNYDGPAPPQGSLVVLHQHSSGGWQAIVDGIQMTAYPADGFALGWIVDRPGTLVVRYDAPPISLLWSIAFCALAAAIAMAFVRPKIETIA